MFKKMVVIVRQSDLQDPRQPRVTIFCVWTQKYFTTNLSRVDPVEYLKRIEKWSKNVKKSAF